MEILNKIKDFIKQLEDRDFYIYTASYFAIVMLILSLLIYFHYRKVSNYNQQLKIIDTQRTQTKKILTNYKAVKLQAERVEDILAENKNFRIGEAYQSIINKLGLSMNQPDMPTPISGETVSGKTEVVLNTHLNSITMKQLTDLLSEIANTIQMYPKDLIIKKTPNSQTIDIDLTIATLEPETSNV